VKRKSRLNSQLSAKLSVFFFFTTVTDCRRCNNYVVKIKVSLAFVLIFFQNVGASGADPKKIYLSPFISGAFDP
jgi:hypothetical protein